MVVTGFFAQYYSKSMCLFLNAPKKTLSFNVQTFFSLGNQISLFCLKYIPCTSQKQQDFLTVFANRDQ